MDVKDLDFIELLQKPVEEPVFARHLEGQLSKQKLETVVGGSDPVNTVVEVSESALPAKKIIAKAVVTKEKAVAAAAITIKHGMHPGEPLCFPYDEPPYYICLESSPASEYE